MAQQTPYIGSKISLISRTDIRYEGILYTVNSNEATIALAKVRSFGTEDRATMRPVPAQDAVYEYIIFKANDIKDLVVCETPKPPSMTGGLAYDPAILSVSDAQPPKVEPSVPPPSKPTVSSSQSNAVPNLINSEQPQSKDPPVLSGGFGQSRRSRDLDERAQQQNAKPDLSSRNDQSSGSDGRRQQQHFPQQQGNRNYTFVRSSNGNDGQNNGGEQRSYNNNSNNNYNNYARYSQRNNNQNMNRTNMYHQTRNVAAAPPNPRDRLKFDSDFDFEKANEKFKEQLGDVAAVLAKVSIEGSEKEPERSECSSPVADENEVFYDKKSSFFDHISCEALEKTEGKSSRPDWKKERLTNQETFGHSAVRSLAYRRGGRGFVHNMGNRSQNRNYHQQNQSQQQRYNNNGSGGGAGNGFRQPRYNNNTNGNYGGNRNSNYQQRHPRAAAL